MQICLLSQVTNDWSVKVLRKAAPVLKSLVAPSCDKLCTDKRHCWCIQTVDLAVARSTTGVHLECDLSFALFARVYHVFFVRSGKKTAQDRDVAHSCVPDRPVPPHDSIDLVAPQSIRASPVSKASLANMLVSVCTATANSLYAVRAIVSPFFSPSFP